MRNKCKDCGICCKQTEMILSETDITLILNDASLNLKREDFIEINNDGFFQLKNVKGFCVFFEPSIKLCEIYKLRPQGCKFYPLIYDFSINKCVLDVVDCPRPNLFYETSRKAKKTCLKIKRFLIEVFKRSIGKND